MQLAVLLKPRKGICTPYQISVDYVSYRHEYKDATTAIIPRGPTWNKHVAAQTVRSRMSGKAPSEKQERFKQARDTTKNVVEPRQSFATEMINRDP